MDRSVILNTADVRWIELTCYDQWHTFGLAVLNLWLLVAQLWFVREIVLHLYCYGYTLSPYAKMVTAVESITFLRSILYVLIIVTQGKPAFFKHD